MVGTSMLAAGADCSSILMSPGGIAIRASGLACPAPLQQSRAANRGEGGGTGMQNICHAFPNGGDVALKEVVSGHSGMGWAWTWGSERVFPTLSIL